jgi:hypothetical protein
MVKTSTVIMAVIVALWSVIPGMAESLPPLPPLPGPVILVPPNASLKKEIQDFCGEWSEAIWTSKSNKQVRVAKLIVTKVDKDTAEILYGCGDSLLSPSKAFWFQGIAQLRKEGERTVMIFSVNDNLHRFWLENGKLIGRNPLLAEITMNKIR